MNLYLKIKEKYHYSTFRFVNCYFPHSAFSTLRIFHTPRFPHSAFSTLRVFHTPGFPHSAFSTLRTPHFSLNQNKSHDVPQIEKKLHHRMSCKFINEIALQCIAVYLACHISTFNNLCLFENPVMRESCLFETSIDQKSCKKPL